MLRELMKWSPDGKGFDLQTNSLNQFFKEMYGAQSGECVFAEWWNGQWVGLAIRYSWVWVPLWPLAGFVLGCPKFKSSALLVNCQLVDSCQLGFLILLPCICIFCFEVFKWSASVLSKLDKLSALSTINKPLWNPVSSTMCKNWRCRAWVQRK